jgi:hypothetical protein
MRLIHYKLIKPYSICYARIKKERNMSNILKLVFAIVIFLFFITDVFAITGTYYRHLLIPTLNKCTTPKDCEEVFVPPSTIISVCIDGFCRGRPWPCQARLEIQFFKKNLWTLVIYIYMEIKKYLENWGSNQHYV